MKKCSIVLIFLMLVSVLMSLDFKVESCELDVKDLHNAHGKVVEDANYDPCAVLRVETDVKPELYISGVDVIKKENIAPGQYYFFVSFRKPYITFGADGYTPYTYRIPVKMEGGRTYKIVLSSKGNVNIIDEDLLTLTLQFNENNVFVAKDDKAPIKVSTNSAIFKMPKGKYSFRFIKEGFNDYSETIDLQANMEKQIVLIKGVSKSKLKLPAIVYIDSDPKGAEIYLNDQRIGTTPYNDELLTGEYALALKKSLYYNYNGNFKIEEGETKEIPLITLKPRWGTIRIETEPSGAKVFLDRKEIGTSPLAEQKLQSGVYKIQAELPLYHDTEQEIKVSDGDNKVIRLNLKQAFGSLSVVSTTAEAEVYLDGKLAGKTPYNKEVIPSGTYQLKLMKDLWSDHEETIVVKDSQDVKKNINMNKNFGTLKVLAEGAFIFVNNKSVADNHYEINTLPGKYSLKAEKKYHKTAEQDIFLKIGETKEVTLIPEPIMGSLSIITNPAEAKGASITINKEKQSKTTPAVIPMLIGDYEVTVSHPKYLNSTQKISLSEGEQKKLLFNLQTYQGSVYASINKWKINKYAALATLIITTGSGYYFANQANDYNDKYRISTLPSEINANYQNWKDNKNNSQMMYGISVVPACWLVYSWVKQSKYEKKL